MTFDEIAPALQTGDVFLFHGTEWTSRLIQEVTHSAYSHAAMIVRTAGSNGADGLSFWQSWEPMGGVVLSDARDFLEQYSVAPGGFISARHLVVNRTTAMGNALRLFENAVIGRPFPSILAFVEHWLEGTTGLDSGSADFFCSQLLAATYIQMGLLPQGPPPNAYSPEMFSYANPSLPLRLGATLGAQVKVTISRSVPARLFTQLEALFHTERSSEQTIQLPHDPDNSITTSLPTLEQVTALEDTQVTATVPVLPDQWRAQVLLTPFGDGAPPYQTPVYDQLAVADVRCWRSIANGNGMRVSVYLLEDLLYFDFLFQNTPDGGQWYWLISQPGGPITGCYGPFATPLVVPDPDFLVAKQARTGGRWNILGQPCTSWVVPANDPPTYGTWLSYRAAQTVPYRLLNISSQNPLRIPILGAYFLASIPTWENGIDGGELAEIEGAVARARQTDYVNPMATQQDIQRAFGAPPFSASACVLQQIQAVIPGIRPLPGSPLPEWPIKLFSTAWDIGLDFIPYATTIWYRYDWLLQRTALIGLGSEPGKGTYSQRSDNILYANHGTSPEFVWRPPIWQFASCGEQVSVGLPSPNWLAKGPVPARIRAAISGNPAFGLAPGQTLNLISKILPRDPPITSLFWVWFTDDNQSVHQRGELFSECEFAPEPQHQIVLVDYVTFDRGTPRIARSDFDEPCATPSVARPPKTTSGVRRVYGPRD